LLAALVTAVRRPAARRERREQATAGSQAAARDYRSIRGAEKILEPGEDWCVLGTSDDPVVQEAVEAGLLTA